MGFFLYYLTGAIQVRRIQHELLKDDQGTNLGKEEKSPRFQAVNEQENILDLTSKQKRPTRFETCCTNASLRKVVWGQKNFVSTSFIEMTI